MESLDKDLLAATIIIIGAIVGFLFHKMTLICRDVMLKRNKKYAKNFDRLKELESITNPKI